MTSTTITAGQTVSSEIATGGLTDLIFVIPAGAVESNNAPLRVTFEVRATGGSIYAPVSRVAEDQQPIEALSYVGARAFQMRDFLVGVDSFRFAINPPLASDLTIEYALASQSVAVTGGGEGGAVEVEIIAPLDVNGFVNMNMGTALDDEIDSITAVS